MRRSVPRPQRLLIDQGQIVLPQIPIETISELLETEIGRSGWHVELVGESSNYVYRCEGASDVLAVRTPRSDPTTPSSFWRQMREIFGLTFPPPPDQFALTAAAVSRAGLASPSLLAAFELDGRPIFITTWLWGDAWAPDEFPPSREVHFALGEFLGRMHTRSEPGFGRLTGGRKPLADYYAAAIASAQSTVDSEWSAGSERLLSVMAQGEPEKVARWCAVVMPDIAGNQFLYSESGIAGVVDIDSYVVGPVELELTIAEWALVDHAAFADGYRSVRALPRFADFRGFHRATMLINEEALTGDLDRLLTERAYFD